MKISLHNLLGDQAARLKANSAKNEETINWIDKTVAPIAPFVTEFCQLGQLAYPIHGGKPGKVEEISDSKTIVIRGQFQRSEEWKPTPWTEEEKTAYWNHRKAESKRTERQTKESLAALEERRKLRKEFLGE